MKIDPSKPLYLTKEEARNIILKNSSYGTDGKVFKINSNYLIKLYHSKIEKLLSKEEDRIPLIEDDSDVKIYQPNTMEFKNKPIDEMIYYYVDEEETDTPLRIRSAEAIMMASERQSRVLKTHLPKNAVYINGHFVGCILLAEHGLQIHNLTGLPMSYKKKIMKKVLENISELFDNCIYHIEMFNKPHSKNALLVHKDGFMEEVGHSHVLVNPITLTPKIIDLDGKSTRYTTKPNKDLEKLSMEGICMLMIEFLLAVDLDEYNEVSDLAYVLEEIGVKAEYIDSLSDLDMTLEEAKDFVDSLENIKTL